MGEENRTPFSAIYDSFLERVTSGMYMELTERDTMMMLQSLLINAIPRFEFPRFDIFDYELGKLVEEPTIEWIGGFFNSKLTQEEINILSLNMVVEWLGQQLATTENTKMKYTGSDFKLTSQANHMAKLKNMIESYKQDSFHLQRLYKRRRIVNGTARSTAWMIMTPPEDTSYRE